jgi:hypothetical protein
MLPFGVTIPVTVLQRVRHPGETYELPCIAFGTKNLNLYKIPVILGAAINVPKVATFVSLFIRDCLYVFVLQYEPWFIDLGLS